MNLIKHRKWIAILAVLALAVSLPAAALAEEDTTPPVATLYSPSGTQAAATANQKIIFSLSEKVTPVAGKNITLSDGTTTCTANANAGTLVGDASLGPWYVVYDLSHFLNVTAPLVSLAAGANYTITAEAGAFTDAAGNASAAATGSFTTAADGSLLAVVFTTTNANQTVTAGGSAIVSGQAVASGTAVVFTIPADGSYTVVKQIKLNGAASPGLDLSNYTLAGDLEVYFKRTAGALSGTPAISGNAYFGGTLSADLSGINQTDTSGITLRWVRVDGATETEVASAGAGTQYTLVEADIGKVIRLDVTDATLTGTLSASTATIAKAPFTGTVTAPAAQSVTDTSVTLAALSGYQYKRADGAWQDEPVFTGLSAGTAYDFYQRVKETATTLASDDSAKTAITTTASLSGTAVITGAAQSGKQLTASLSGSNASGTITYTWQRAGATVGTGQSYTPGSADIGQVLTLIVTTSEQTGSLSASTAAVLKAENANVPAAPTMASATATSITLNAVAGYQYSLGGVYWQDTTTFHNLVAGSTYTFYQREAESTTAFASAPSAGVNFTTVSGLTGTILASGEARYGITITASLDGSNNTGALTYTWKRGTLAVGTGTAYAVSAADIGNQLSLEVTSSVQGGSVTRSFGTVAKAYYVGNAPAAPTRYSRSTSKIVLNTVEGCEYSRGGTTWQDSATFSGLKSGTSYTFYQRYKATATTEASPASAAYKTSTSASSSGSDDSDSSTTTTPKPSASNDAGATALYTYTLTQDNTRILYSTMKSLAEGNKTQDVTIKQEDVEFTFPKGTMTQSYTQLWYDFGTTINNSIAVQTAQQIAGDAYVAAVHFNYSGELPGKASIRFRLGAEHAGKTLYYYLLNDDDTLTFQQTSVVDTSGWATVEQTHCSDYVFLDRDIASVSPSPSPTPEATVSPLATPSASPEGSGGGFGSDGWLIAAIILIAVALIVGGIWLYTKNRGDRIEDEDDENNLF